MIQEDEICLKVYSLPSYCPVLMTYLAGRMTDSRLGQLINFGEVEKKEAIKKLHVSRQKLEEQFDKLVEEKSLKHIGYDLYQVNPFLFGKGDWVNVSDLQSEYFNPDTEKEWIEKYTINLK